MKTGNDLLITEVRMDKRLYMPLLLIGDESEAMINRYIDSGRLYVGFLGDVAVAVCVTVAVGASTVEVKNLAVGADFRRHGFGARMLRHVEGLNFGKTITLGTGETPSTLHFYKLCGYTYSHRIPRFFVENYPEPIVEEGVRLCDMIYLKKEMPR